MKIYSLRYANIVVGLLEKLINIFKVNENVKKHDRQEMLNRHIIFTEYLFKLGTATYALSMTIYFVYPIYRYVNYDEIIPLIMTFLPGIDENSHVGYICITVFHLHLIILGILGSACSDFTFTMIIVNVPILGHIIGDNIKELNEILMEKSPKPIFIKAKLQNILLQHLEIKE